MLFICFLFEVIEVVVGDKIQRTTHEEELLKEQIELGNWDNCFNFQKKPKSGERSCYSKTLEETKKKLSKSSKERWENPEYRKQISEARKITWQEEEYRELQSKQRKVVWEDIGRKETHQKQMSDYEDELRNADSLGIKKLVAQLHKQQ